MKTILQVLGSILAVVGFIIIIPTIWLLLVIMLAFFALIFGVAHLTNIPIKVSKGGREVDEIRNFKYRRYD